MSKLSVTVVDPGKGAPTYLWTKLRAKGPKNYFWRPPPPPPPLSKGVDERPPLSQALDPALHYFTFEWSFKAKSVVFIDDLLFAVG